HLTWKLIQSPVVWLLLSRVQAATSLVYFSTFQTSQRSALRCWLRAIQRSRVLRYCGIRPLEPYKGNRLRRRGKSLMSNWMFYRYNVRPISTRPSMASQRGAGAMVMLSSPLVAPNVQVLAELALRHRFPAITLFPDFARAGGLLAYGPNLLSLHR